MLKSISDVFESDNEIDIINIAYALNNSMRYKELHEYISKYRLYSENKNFIESAIKSASFCGDDEMADFFSEKYVMFFDDEDSKDFIEHINEIRGFFKENKDIKDDMHSYLIDCLDVFSRRSLLKSKEIDGTYGYSHHIYSDEGYSFLAFSFIFQLEDTHLEDIMDIEDEFISLISRINYSPIVKTKISFNFELGDLS